MTFITRRPEVQILPPLPKNQRFKLYYLHIAKYGLIYH